MPTYAGGAILILFLLLALLGHVVAPHGADDQNLIDALANPSRAHTFGTDPLGRDVLSRVILGTRLTMSAALIATGAAPDHVPACAPERRQRDPGRGEPVGGPGGPGRGSAWLSRARRPAASARVGHDARSRARIHGLRAASRAGPRARDFPAHSRLQPVRRWLA